MTDKQQGLIDKFEVERLTPSSRGIDHSECRYFVLDPQHDPMAREALYTYALRAKMNGYRELYNDLLDWLDDLR